MSNKMTTEQVTKQTVVSILRDQKVKAELTLLLPKNLSVDRFIRLVLSEVSRNPKLNSCDPREFILAVSTVAQLGLELGPVLGHAFIVPFYNSEKDKTEPQVIIGYKGMIELAYRSGRVININAWLVYEKDTFEVEFGLTPKLVHVPNFEDQNRGEIKLAYAVAHLVGGGVHFEILSKHQILKSKPKTGSKAWGTSPEEMFKKTTVRRLFKMLPISTDMSRAITIDDAADADISQINIIDTEGEFVDQGTGEIQKISIKPIEKEEQQDQKTETTNDPFRQKETIYDGLDELEVENDNSVIYTPQ